MNCRKGTWLLVAAALTAAATPMQGQSSAEVNAGLEFNFGSPGARSLARGGAFVGLADDATAAYTNPAGLTNILRPELSIEGRAAAYTNTFTDRGHAFGPPSKIGFDNLAGVHEASIVDRRAGVSFLSFVLPHDRWSMAIHRHELMNFRASASSHGIYFDLARPGQTETNRIYPAKSRADLSIVSYGATAAFRLYENLSIGMSLVRQQFNLRSSTARYATEFFDAPDYAIPFAIHEQSGKDWSLAFTTGLLWRLTPRLQVGATYQQGSQFDVGIQTTFVNSPPEAPLRAKFTVPSVYRAGAALGLDSYTTLSLELDYIRYSALTRSFAPINKERPLYGVDDGTEIHLGIERMLVADWLVRATRYPVIVAAGAWRDPDHRIRYADPNDPQSILFGPGKDQLHWSVGVGLSVGRSHTINAAFDYSRRQRTVSFSGVTRF
ncbi:MAG: hypothetical protein JWO56_735 [Acidobacteria bacterium]|nr:hypothetical protein [Acidobacteriota bacterium]